MVDVGKTKPINCVCFLFHTEDNNNIGYEKKGKNVLDYRNFYESYSKVEIPRITALGKFIFQHLEKADTFLKRIFWIMLHTYCILIVNILQMGWLEMTCVEKLDFFDSKDVARRGRA